MRCIVSPSVITMIEEAKDLFKSELDGIAGLGKVRKQALLKAFGSVSKIAEASLEELLQYVPKAVAIAIKDKIG
jgi:excinuclease ABC subunit C